MTRFSQARLKHQWAYLHISQLEAQWKAFQETNFCNLVVQDHPNGGQVLSIVSINALPPEVKLLIGDIVHNFRCALDYIVGEILGWKDLRLTFPMDEEKQNVLSSFRTRPEIIDGKTIKKGRNAPIETAVPGIGEFIVNEIRPYKLGNDFLWPLGKLDNRDKHRFLITTVVPQRINGINAVSKSGSRLQNCGAGINSGGTFSPFGFPDGGLKIESYGKPTAELLFNEVGIIEHKPVLQTLSQISREVEVTINRIDEFLTSVGWSRP